MIHREDFYNLAYKESFPVAAVLANNRYLFFATLYNNILYRIDMKNEAKDEMYMPIKDKKKWPFRVITYYEESVFLAPFHEDIFLKYNTKTREFDCLDTKGDDFSFRYGIVVENKWVLLDADRNIIVIFNLEGSHVETTISLPEFDPSGNRDSYVSFKQYGSDLIVFSNHRKYLLIVSIEKGASSWIETKHSFCFGEIEGTDIFYTSCASQLDGIYCYNIETQKTRLVKQLQSEHEADLITYRYWNNKKIGDSIYFLPHECSKILKYNLVADQTEYIYPFAPEHVTKRDYGEMAVYDIIEYKNNLVAVPFFGNTVSIIENDGEIIKSYVFPIEKKILMESAFLNFEKRETVSETYFDIEDYLSYICNTTENKLPNEHQMIGNSLWKHIMEKV